MTQIISIMPNPGGGTRIAGDTPQQVLFFVTDGVEDGTVNGLRVQSPRDPSTAPRSRIAESASPCSTRPICRCRSATLEPAARLETCNGGRRGAVAQPSKRGTALLSRRTAVGTFLSKSRPLREPVSPVWMRVRSSSTRKSRTEARRRRKTQGRALRIVISLPISVAASCRKVVGTVWPGRSTRRFPCMYNSGRSAAPNQTTTPAAYRSRP